MILALVGQFVLAGQTNADVSTPAIFSDNMVLQRGAEVPIWGWSDPGDEVIVKARDQSVGAKVDEDGRWMVKLKPMDVGEPFELSIKGSHNEITFQNVVMGEVWLCGGQSNMAWTVVRSRDAEKEKAAANYPKIRHIGVQRKFSATRQVDVPTTGWEVCSPQTVGEFTAVGYYFARHLHKELNVPIGLLHSTWGGTPIEAWTSGKSLKTHPDYAESIAKIEADNQNLEQLTAKHKTDLAAWKEKLKQLETESEKQSSSISDSWAEINAPGKWESQGHPNLDGIAWYRRTVEIPQAWVGKELSLSVGRIDDRDRTFVNGTEVGSKQRHNILRKYKVAGELITDNTIDIAIEVNDTGGAGGIIGPVKQMNLSTVGGADTVSLAGKWKFKPLDALAKIGPSPKPPGFVSHRNPTALFNAMINPLVPYSFKGAIWYQGEANADRAKQYQTLFPLLIEDWRKEWKREFPFYWVQLANFMAPASKPTKSAWAELREAQSMTRKLPQTGEAVIIDIGAARNIHPTNKQDVGLRLAFHALAKDYGKTVTYSGPRYKSMSIDGNKIRLQFEFADGLKTTDGEGPHYFSIAGEEKKFVWAEAKIDGNEVVVMSGEIAEPKAVRYAWANNPEGCNLTNASGIPASPFRTDTWPGITEKNK